MLGLRIGQTNLDTSPGFSISFEWVNDVLDLTETKPSFTYPITLPSTPTNRKALGYPSAPGSQIVLPSEYTDAAITYKGNDLFKGVVELLQAEKNTISVAFRFSLGFLTTQIANKKLVEYFPTETIAIDFDPVETLVIEYDFSNSPNGFAITVSGTEYVMANETIAGLFANFAAGVFTTFSAFFESYTISGPGQITFEKKSGVPLPGTSGESRLYIDDFDPPGEPIENWPYTSTAATVTLPTEINLTSADLGVKFELPTLYLPNLYNGENTNWNGFVNLYRAGEYELTPPADVEPTNHLPTTLLPCLKDNWVFETLFSKLGITLSGDYLDDTELNNRLFFVPRPIDKEIAGQGLNAAFSFTVPVNELLPDITVGAYFNSIKKEFGLITNYDPFLQELRLDFLSNIFESTDYIDWSAKVADVWKIEGEKYEGVKLSYKNDTDDLEVKDNVKTSDEFTLQEGDADTVADLATYTSPAEADVRFVKSKNAFYRYDGAEWAFFKHNLDSYRELQEAKSLQSEFTPLTDTDIEEGGRTMRLAQADLVGNIPFFSIENKLQKPRFTHYRGLQADSVANNYPMATITRYKQDETQISGLNYDFTPAHNDANTVLSFYQKLIEFWQDSKIMSTTVLLSLTDFMQISLHKKVLINGVSYLIKNISADLSEAGLSPCQVELYRLGAGSFTEYNPVDIFDDSFDTTFN